MTRWLAGLLALGAVLAVALAIATRSAQDRDAYLRGQLAAQIIETRQWQARYAEAAMDAQKRDTVVRLITRTYKAERDSVLIHLTDTVSVVRFVTVADSMARACTDLADSCRVFRAVADSTIRAERGRGDAYAKLAAARRPRLLDRVGVSCGYGFTKAGAQVLAGPQCGASVRLWP